MEEYSWFVAKDRQQLDGEHSTADVLGMLQESPGSSFMVWRAGMDAWAPPEDLPEFQQESEETRALEMPAPDSETSEADEESAGTEEASGEAAAEEEVPSVAEPEDEPVPEPEEPAADEPEESPALEPEPEERVPASVANPTIATPVKPVAPEPRRPAPRSSSPRSAQPAKGWQATLKGLLDFKFETLIGRDVAKIVYILVMVVAGLVALLMAVSGLGTIITGIRFGSVVPILGGLVTIAVAPIIALLYLAIFRLAIEVVIVIFGIHEKTSTLAERLEALEKMHSEDG